MSATPTGSMPSSTLFGIVDQQGEARLSLDKFVEMDSPSVFVFKHKGSSMSPYILDGDRVVLDRSKSYSDNSLVLVEYNGDVLCRRYIRSNGRPSFHAYNKSIKAFVPEAGELVSILGVVTHVVREV